MKATSRRYFLSKSITGLAGLLTGANTGLIPGLFFAPTRANSKAGLLVCIFLRGGMDGLNVVIPYGDSGYYQNRPTIAIQAPSSTDKNTAIDLDGFFGMHPALEPLKPVWQAHNLSFIHAAGSPDPTHSHFDAQRNMEDGLDVNPSQVTGWLARHLHSAPWKNDSRLASAIAVGSMLPLSLRGPAAATSIRSLADFRLGGRQAATNPVIQQIQAILPELFNGQTLLDAQARLTFEVLSVLDQFNPAGYLPAHAAAYPDTPFAQGLKQAAQLYKADLGLEIATLDVGGFDTHIHEGDASGILAGLLGDLAQGLAAFYADLQDQFSQVTVVAMSEFGRRVQENGNGGTDHGHGNVLMVLSGGLQGGKVYGKWPGLAPAALYGPGDLNVTTDFRSVLGEILQKRAGNPNLDAVFPGFSGPNFPGLFE